MAASSRTASDSSYGLAIRISGEIPNFGSSSKLATSTSSSRRTQAVDDKPNLKLTEGEADHSFESLARTSDSHTLNSKRQLNPATEDSTNGSPVALEGNTQSRKQSLLSVHSGQTAVEFKQILGNSNSRLQAGVELSSGLFFESPISQTGNELSIALEQAKSRSRVNLDILLESNICVQGGCLRGYVQIRVRKQLKKDQPTFLSEGRLSLIGFEDMDSDAERSIFYRSSARLSDITLGLERIYSSKPDSEGFSRAAEGIHSLPFVFHLSSDSEIGTPKGALLVPPGISIRYVAMVSLTIKDPTCGEKSIVHFYRDCIIWPRLNPSIVLAPTSRPIQVTASESLRKTGNGQVTLTASLHRLHWVSGQSCYVRVKIANHSEKALKNLRLQLMRCTTLYRVGCKFEASEHDGTTDSIADIAQSSTNTNVVAVSLLEVCARRTRGHASAKGWWSGVIPGQTRTLSHHVLIPSDALSISRGNIVEVSYTLEVVVQVGKILPIEVKVSLPIEIINFLSIDPPPSTFMINLPGGVDDHETKPSGSQALELESPTHSEHSRADSEFDQEEDRSSSDETYDGSDNPTNDTQINIPLAEVDDDEKSPPRFADLYYSSLQKNLDKAAQGFFDARGQVPEYMQNATGRVEGENESTFATRVRDKYLQRQTMLASASNASQEDQRQDHKKPSSVNPDEGAAPAMEASPPNLPASFEAACHPRSTSHTRHNSHTQRDAVPPKQAQQTMLSRSVSNDVSNMVPETAQRSPTELETPISGVALPDSHILKPYWKTPNSSKSLPPVPNDDDIGRCNVPEENAELEKSRSVATPAVPARVGSPSAPRAGSVKDKIRELEELAAKTEIDA